jgi:uncharacterized protein (DUF2252 family)
MLTVDPMTLARRQLTLDHAKTTRYEELGTRLLDQKLARMTASPLALLRGAAPLFYELLAAHPSLADGPRGKGWIAGDLHLENFGAYRVAAMPDAPKKKGKPKKEDHDHDHDHDADEVEFDLNDFDDAVIGPWRFDVLRLATSLILGGRELGADGPRVLGLTHALLDAYGAAAFGPKPKLPPRPAPVARLVEQVTSRTRKALLDARTEVKHGARHFVRGARYADLPEAIAARVEKAFARYVKGLEEHVRPPKGSLDVLDAAWRIAGTGSLGGVRVALLVRGKGGEDGAWVFDMKEQGTPSAACIVGKGPKGARLAPADRVVAAMRGCLAQPPRYLGATRMGDLSMFVRRLSPQEDKLDLAGLRDADLDPLATYLGALVGRAHARGATKAPRMPWTKAERDGIVDRAIAIAGIHEAVYLALCKLARERSAR